MAKQTTLRIPESLAAQAEVLARTQDKSFNQFIIDCLQLEIDRLRRDPGFMTRAKKFVERDRLILDQLSR